MHPLARRWDQVAGDPAEGGLKLAAGNAATLVADTWLNLEDGVQVQFPGAAAASFRTGDYWLIPARVATGDVLWPQESGVDAQGNTVTNPVARLPDGIITLRAARGRSPPPPARRRPSQSASVQPGVRASMSQRWSLKMPMTSLRA